MADDMDELITVIIPHHHLLRIQVCLYDRTKSLEQLMREYLRSESPGLRKKIIGLGEDRERTQRDLKALTDGVQHKV